MVLDTQNFCAIYRSYWRELEYNRGVLTVISTEIVLEEVLRCGTSTFLILLLLPGPVYGTNLEP